MAQADSLDLCVVLNPLRNFLLLPCPLGSLIKKPGIFSSPISAIVTSAASPNVLFSTL